jgi:hypothetical protein
MATVFNNTTLRNLAAAQAQGYDIFTVGSGPFTAGDWRVGIANLKPSDEIEAEKTRNTAVRVIAKLYSTPTDELINVWDSESGRDRARTIEYIQGGKGKVLSNKYTQATTRGWIGLTKETPGLGPEFGTYQPVLQNPTVKAIMLQNNMTEAEADNNSAKLVNLIIESPQLKNEILQFYANYLGGMNNEDTDRIIQAHLEDSKVVAKEMEDMVTTLSQQDLLVTGQPEGQRSSTQILSDMGSMWLSNNLTVDVFKEDIVDARSDGISRNTHLMQLQDSLFESFSNRRWILGSEQDARDAIMRYISEQYDLAAEEMSQ